MKKSTWVLIGVLVFLIASSVGAAGYFGYKYYKADKDDQNADGSANTVAEDPYASWNTFISEKLYFTFKYPSAWTYEQSGYSNEKLE